MDPRLLKHYNRELQFIREMGGEFAKEFPKIAGRLGLDAFECADPYVERLLEGFAFLAARVQLKAEAEFPRFTQHLLELVYPHYLAPTPSMAVVQLNPDLTEGGLADGFVVRRDAALRSPLGQGDQTPCEYRTAHDVTLWPIEITQAEYFTHSREVASLDIREARAAKAGIRLRLKATAGLTFQKIALDRLVLFLRGGELAHRVYEQMLGNASAVLVRPGQSPAPWHEVIPDSGIGRVGFDERQALIPYGTRSFQGYRLLHEYFAFPERYLFVEIAGLETAVRRCTGDELDVIVLLDRSDPSLLNVVDTGNFALFCTPAINLFPKRADSIQLTDREAEYHVVPDRNAPMDFEVYDVKEVVGTGPDVEGERVFLPFYARTNLKGHGKDMAFYTLHRVPRLLSARQRRTGPRSNYIGNEVFLSLVDAREAPFSSSLRQLALTTLCTNRDLPLHLSVGQGRSDFTLQSSGPVQSVRCVAGPTAPRPTHAEGETAWRLISHLSLNYLTLMDSAEEQGAVAMRDLLMLYGGDNDAALRLQVDGVKSVVSAPVTRRIPTFGPIAFGRGMEITVTFDEAAFSGSGVFLLGEVLEEFFAKYVSINSFTETVVRTLQRGEIIRWPARTGRRDML